YHRAAWLELEGGEVALQVARHDAAARSRAVAELDCRPIALDDVRVRDDEPPALRLSRVPQDPRARRRAVRPHLHGDLAELAHRRAASHPGPRVRPTPGSRRASPGRS